MSRSFTYRLEGDIKRYMNGHSDKEEAADSTCRLNIKRASQQKYWLARNI